MAPTILYLMLAIITVAGAMASRNFSGILIFGDSTVDTGNNNYVQTIFKSNHIPYGQDFPNHVPTGRLSNGKLIPDFAASFLGIKETVPPVLDPSLTDDDIRTGVCFASAGSGNDNLTSAVSGVIPIYEQLELFRDYIRRLKGIVGEERANKMISGALIIVSSDTNDMVFNYYDIRTRRHQFDISGYQDFLLDALQNFVQELYNLGGRAIAIAGLPPIGCLPIQIAISYGNSGDLACLEDQNSDAQAYNRKLANLLTEWQASLPGSILAYANVYDPLIDMVNHPQQYSFIETQRGCCGTGFVEAGSSCNKWTPTCGNPSQFMFWDSIHPTESAYKFLTDCLIKNLLPKIPPNVITAAL